MGLERYNAKRDFTKTAEPSGEHGGTTGHSYCIQKHAARRLHYDLRLEADGVLKSWAVPKGPSFDPRDKRLAVQVEDHPLEYASFEGTIPKGQYGGGTVMVWDRGTWQPYGDVAQGFADGVIKFELYGEKLCGGWALIRLPGGGDKKNWLLIKEKDAIAQQKAGFDVVTQLPDSVISGRDLSQIARPSAESTAGSISAADLPGAIKGPLPGQVTLQLATLAAKAPVGEAWLSEIKYDGYRMLCQREPGNVKLISRNGKDWTAKFPAIQAAIDKAAIEDAIFDGEIVVLNDQGRSDFQALQNYLKIPGQQNLLYFVFDLLWYGGYDLRMVSLVQRKQLLEQVMAGIDNNNVRYSRHIVGQGPEFFAEACKLSLEGIVVKKADSLYEGKRTRAWLKIKCVRRQKFVVAGYTEPGGARTGFGALVLGQWEDKYLHYCGRVGTGFTDQELMGLAAKLREREVSRSPFDELPGGQTKDVHWVRPELVVEVAFTEWTNEGSLRHPSFIGEAAEQEALTANKPTTAPKVSRTAARVAQTVAGIKITNPAKVLYEREQIAKIDVLRYYEQAASKLLPHVAERPLTLIRCPQGGQGQMLLPEAPYRHNA